MLKSPLLNAAAAFCASALLSQITVASVLLGIAFFGATTALSGTLTTLYSFSATDPQTHANSDGAYPGGLTLGKDGNFYGTAKIGGANNGGTVFKITTDGVFTLLYSFTGGASSANSDGGYPGGLAVDASGSFYGVTAYGSNGTGTVFKLTTDGTAVGTKFTTLYTFGSEAVTSSPPGGAAPQGILALDSQGNIYGTTEGGGIGTDNIRGGGTVFKITTDGTAAGTALTTLHAFGSLDQYSKPDGAFPRFGLTQGSDGNFYGTTDFTVFQITPSGALTTVHMFTQGDHGYPQPSALLEGPAGIFYGMNVSDGDLGLGQLFEFTAGGDYAVIYAFADPPYLINNYAGTNLDGAYPASWVKASDGSLYGITSTYGPYGDGTLFKFKTDGTAGGTVLTTLYAFSSPYSIVPLPEGSPTGVALGPDGTIYGTMSAGANKSGAVFRFDPLAVSPLPPTSLVTLGTPTNGNPMYFIASQASTVPGLVVRIQYTTTTNIESSWTDLPDGHGGQLTLGASGLYSFGTIGTTFYPAGTAVYFRAITSALGFTDSVSSPSKPFTLEQANLTINVRLTSTSDPSGALHIAHIGDTLTYTLIWTNIGTATAHKLHVITPVPTYIDAASDLTYQFASNNLIYNRYGAYTKSSPGAENASVTWAVSDLPPGSSQAVTLGVRLGSSVRLQQAIGLPNNYEAYSSVNEPPTAATGFSSGAANPATTILAPITFTLFRSSATVAPGGLFTYTCILSNLTTAAVAHAVAVVDVPQYARFATSYPTGPKTSKSGLIYSGKGTAPTYKHIYYQNGDQSQVVIQVGSLAARGDTLGRDTETLYVTFQAEWADPAQVPTLSTGDYLAAFVNTASYPGFTAAYNAAGSTTAAPGTTDFIAHLSDPSRDIALSKNESGEVNISLQGSLADAPELHLLKILSASLTNSQSDGNGHTVSIVKPGDEITFALVASNEGNSEADDVYIEDVMPDSSSYVSGGLLYATTKTKSTPSTLNSAATFTIVLDPDGHHLRFEGLKIAPGDSVSLEYTARVFNGTKTTQPAPPPGTFIDPAVGLDKNGLPRPDSIGSSSTPDTWAGFYVAVPLEVVGPNQFAQPIMRALIQHPAVSADVNATSNTLTAFYKKYPNDVPLTNAANPAAFFPGFERYYIHYVNTGKAVTGAKINVPLPAHASFLRASFVRLTPNVIPGALGYLPGIPIANPSGAGIVPPSNPDGTVIFKLPPLGVAQQGDVMVEVIIAPDAVQAAGSLLGDPNGGLVAIYDSTITTPARLAREVKKVTLVPPSHQNTVAFEGLELTADYLAELAAVPSVGILKWLPRQVRQGDTFQVALVIYNYGAVGAHAIVDFTIPPNTEFVSADAGQSSVSSVPDPSPGHLVEAVLASGNGPIYMGDLAPLAPHTAAGLTVTLRATGNVGSAILETNAVVFVDHMGRAYALASSTSIVDTKTTVSPANLMVHTSVPLFQTIVNGTDVAILDIGGGNIVASGAGNIVSSGAGNIVASGAGNIVSSGAGNIVASGAGNLIPIGATTGASLLANQASIVASGAGNILVPEGATIVASGAGNIVAAGAGNIVSQGAGNIVSQGAGNIVSQGAGNIVSQGAGNIVAQGAGNIVAAGAGNIVSQGAGNIVAQGAGNIVASGAGNILASTPGSTAVIGTAAGNLFGIGGGSFKPSQ